LILILLSFGLNKKWASLISHRYDRLPLLSSDPGGVQRELVVSDLPAAKVVIFFGAAQKNFRYPLRGNYFSAKAKFKKLAVIQTQEYSKY
jgi:hypothetical protein